MEFKGTKGEWDIRHSESKNAYNVVGTVLGGKYKVARCPYVDGSDMSEAKANAALIAAAPELLEACLEFVRKVECGEAKSTKSYQHMKSAIAKATTI